VQDELLSYKGLETGRLATDKVAKEVKAMEIQIKISSKEEIEN
jgi:hypothetical protein